MTSPAQPSTAPRRWLAREIGATLALGGPIVLTNVAVNLMTTTDVMMLGWLSPHALAAGALGFNRLYAAVPVLRRRGRRGWRRSPPARSAPNVRDFAGVRAVAPSGAAERLPARGAGLGRCCGTPRRILQAIGEPPELAAVAGRYMHGLQWALAPALLYFATRCVFAALDRVGRCWSPG